MRELTEDVRVEDSWEYEQELDLVDKDLEHIANQLRADETKKLVNTAERSIKRQLLEPVEVAMSKPIAGLWENIISKYQDVVEAAEYAYLAKAKGECLVASIARSMLICRIQLHRRGECYCTCDTTSQSMAGSPSQARRTDFGCYRPRHIANNLRGQVQIRRAGHSSRLEA